MDIQSAQPTPHSPVVTLYLTLEPKLTDTLRRLSGIFFFAKEVIFSSMSVCLSVRLSVNRITQTQLSNLHEVLRNGWIQSKDQNRPID